MKKLMIKRFQEVKVHDNVIPKRKDVLSAVFAFQSPTHFAHKAL
jgi:hypothetical protein